MNSTFKKNILVIDNLTVGYQEKNKIKIIANNISLNIKRGSFVAIIGKNGIGKSTLLKTISKVLKQLNGSITINGKNINEYSYREFAKTISLVLTERLPESQLTVLELIALGRQPHTNWIDTLSKIDIEKIEWAIKETNLEKLRDNRIDELSDGQLQRVLIARALAQDTEIIILDEPTAHLDMHQTIKIFELLKKLTHKTEKTIIISSHEINLAIKTCDQLTILSKNKIYSGTISTLMVENAFENLFSSEIVKFNRTLQQFVINKN